MIAFACLFTPLTLKLEHSLKRFRLGLRDYLVAEGEFYNDHDFFRYVQCHSVQSSIVF